jgi:malate dehydrogenase (oxaloacetate-decarboxylating)(NADP+)
VLLEKIARPILAGRPPVIEMRLKKMGSKLKCQRTDPTYS